MQSVQNKRFLSIVLLLVANFTLSVADEELNVEQLQFPDSANNETADQHLEMIEYITQLFCANDSYRFNHIYVERSLSTGLADTLINRINECMIAGVLISRYNYDSMDDFRINYPMSPSSSKISIRVYNLNIVRNLDTLNLSWFTRKIPGKPQAKTFILCEEELTNSSEAQLQEIFADIWTKQVFNVVIVYWNQTLSAVSFTPFPTLQLLFIPEEDLFNEKALFWDKSRNLYGYPLKITAFYDYSRARFNRNQTQDLSAMDGVDGLLGRLIVDKMNATLNMSEPKDGLEIGELLPNKTATGCLGALSSGEFDIGLNVRFYRTNHFEGRVEASHTNGRDDICFLVPRKGKAIDIWNIFRPFLLNTWLLIIASFPFYGLIFYFMIYRQKNRRSIQFHFFQFYGYLLSQSGSFNAITRRQRILIVFWMFFVILLTTMYQGKMSGALIIPKDQPDIDTIEDLARSDLKVVALTRYNQQFIEFFSDPKYKGVYKPLFKRLINSTIKEFNAKIAKLDPAYGFANKYHINVHLRRVYTTESASNFYHQMAQCAVPFVGVYGIQYGTPYKDQFNFIIRQAQEGGLIEKWERVNKLFEQKAQAKLDSSQGNVAFNLIDLQTAFYVYFLGCVVSIVGFCAEKMYERARLKKLLKNDINRLL